jgi:glutamate/tyrosine decarboxylase-like PLP-dependent enzyme
MSQDLSYIRTVLFRNSTFEIVECRWNSKSVSAMHSHGHSQCCVLVQEGLFKDTQVKDGQKTVSERGPNDSIVTPMNATHEIRCLSDVGRTIHVYSPPLAQKTDSPNFATPTQSSLLSDPDLSLNTESPSFESLSRALEAIRAKSISTDSPLFMNQLFSGVRPESLLSDAVLSASKTTMATLEASPVFSAIEVLVVKELGKVSGWDFESVEGLSVPGGSAANFMACARQALDASAKELGNQSKTFAVFVSNEAHYSFLKACAVLGLGTNSVVRVACNEQGEMLPDALELAIEAACEEGRTPLLVCATAGTTVLGAFDPITEISKICQAQNLWHHVDAAWGGPVLFSKTHRHLMNGIERADSMTFDAHKLLGASLSSSFFVTRHKKILLAANDVFDGGYLFHSDSDIDRGRLSWQCGRRADALSFWALIKGQGTQGLGDHVDRLMRLKDDVARWVKDQPRLTLIATPQFLNICVRVTPPKGQEAQASQWSKIVRDRLRDSNLAFVNFSTNSQGSFLRLILAHQDIELVHVQNLLLAALQES